MAVLDLHHSSGHEFLRQVRALQGDSDGVHLRRGANGTALERWLQSVAQSGNKEGSTGSMAEFIDDYLRDATVHFYALLQVSCSAVSIHQVLSGNDLVGHTATGEAATGVGVVVGGAAVVVGVEV